jgi:hypothetical protein
MRQRPHRILFFYCLVQSPGAHRFPQSVVFDPKLRRHFLNRSPLI